MYRNRGNCGCGRQMVQNNTTNTANNNPQEKCQCGFSNSTVFPTNYMYGQSYVPIQQMNETFKPECALKIGSLFPELVSPYEPCQNMEENAYLRRMTQNEGRCPNQANQ